MARFRLGFVLAIAAALSAGLAASVAAQEAPDRDWYWCQLAERPYGRTVYVSEVFTPPAGAGEVEVETAFEDHVQRRYVREPVAGGLCLGPKASREDAVRDRRNTIDSLRRDRVTVVRTDWRFRGRGSDDDEAGSARRPQRHPAPLQPPAKATSNLPSFSPPMPQLRVWPPANLTS